MPESEEKRSEKRLTVRYSGRIAQIGFLFRKFLRMFVYQNDWKMLPMAAVIAALAGFVLSENFRRTMEGTLTGVFAIVCICIWNGAFNSIQVICRERDVIKREHRSGMHITSYIMAHMMYQLILCILQTAVSLTVLNLVGMKVTGTGLITPWLSVDIGITMLLVTYASDLLSLWISALVHSTTTAMTIMPFVLIFQLIFSDGGLFTLPDIADPIIALTLSSPGLKAMASQMQANSFPYGAVSGMLNLVDDVEFQGDITIGRVLDALGNYDNATIAEIRAIPIESSMTVREIGEFLLAEDEFAETLDTEMIKGLTYKQALALILNSDDMDELLSANVGFSTTIGEAADYLAESTLMQEHRDEGITITTTLGDIMDLAGRKEVKALIADSASKALYNPDYEYSIGNIAENWLDLLLDAAVYAILAVITLEFIDKDKR